MRHDVVVCGAGAAGLLCALRAARAGLDVLVLERNPKAGVKILASGGGRCNLTTTREGEALLRSFPEEQRAFLRHALRAFPPRALRDLFAGLGVATVEEDLEKVFPRAGRASVVVAALLGALAEAGGELRCGHRVTGVTPEEGGFRIDAGDASVRARHCVLAVGGRSWPRAGTTGDGYELVERLGHRVSRLVPHLVGLVADDPALAALAGLTLPDVVCHLLDAEGRRVASAARPLLFTHRGLSGPGPMNLAGDVAAGRGAVVRVELLPGLAFEHLERELLEAARRAPRRRVASVLGDRVPERLARVLCARAGVDPEAAVSQLPRAGRRELVHRLRGFDVPVRGTLGWERAEVTRGGVALAEVDPRTLESRRVPGLWLVGEILDVDGPIGGFNFQAAFATGWLAAGAIARREGRDALRS